MRREPAWPAVSGSPVNRPDGAPAWVVRSRGRCGDSWIGTTTTDVGSGGLRTRARSSGEEGDEEIEEGVGPVEGDEVAAVVQEMTDQVVGDG